MSKKKRKADAALSPATEEMGYQSPAGLDIEREEIYAAFDEQQTGLADPAPETAEAPKEPEAPEVPEEESTSETSPEEEATDEKKYVKSEEEAITEDEKTVPHGAFHEEREKRKAAQRKVSTLEDTIRELTDKAAQVPAKSAETEDAEEYLGEDAAEIKTLKKQLQELQGKEDVRERREEDTRKQGEVDELTTLVDKTDVQLTKDGFPGFKFMTAQITTELNRLIKDDPDNSYLDNPEGWAKIYRDKVFPEVKGMFARKDKETVLDKKKLAKEAAALIGTSGKDTSGASDKKKKDEDWSYADYMDLRKETSAL